MLGCAARQNPKFAKYSASNTCREWRADLPDDLLWPASTFVVVVEIAHHFALMRSNLNAAEADAATGHSALNFDQS